MKSDYISIAEYAKIKGVSVSAVYKRLKTTLQPYSTYDENGKMALKRDILAHEGLEEFQPSSTPFQPCLEETSSTPPQKVEGIEKTIPLMENKTLQQIIDILEAQLKEKDLQIERLQIAAAEDKRQIEESNRHIREQEIKLAELLSQAQELQRNNQILLGQSQQILKLESREKQKKKGIFKRLFSHKSKLEGEIQEDEKL